ncbi:MAG TPA: ABC transporter ATP-binding protein [Bryobacteraceae bacterium]|nr:ABC transporter ATP-binding protein [Bryobacteraceae bacterium]
MGHEPGVSAHALEKRFGAVVAVRDFNLTVNHGEIVGLLGPNGAGKTTVLRMLAGILTPDSGSVTAGGASMSENPLEAKRRIGFLSGDTQLYQRLSPREMLRYFGQLYELPPDFLRKRIAELTGELDMDSFAGRPCGTLSAGQKQRANIARAFLHDPDILILDEPTNALDVITGRFIVDAIRSRRAAGRAVLFSTHIMGEAEYLCDRVVMIHRGAVVEQGTVAEIVARSGRKTLTDAFLAAIGAEDNGRSIQ